MNGVTAAGGRSRQPAGRRTATGASPGCRAALRLLACLCLACLRTALADPAAGLSGLAALWSDAGAPRAGLCVVVGCTNAALLAQAAREGDFLIHGLAPSAAVADALRRDRPASLPPGRLSVDCLPLSPLPYADHLVNLLIVPDAARAFSDGLSAGEVFRALAPLGVALLNPGTGPPDAAALGGMLTAAGFDSPRPLPQAGWVAASKPWPSSIDAWTHLRHAPDGNEVAADTRVGPPERLQWWAGPTWSRAHDGAPPTIHAMVSALGRLFYLCDEVPPHVRGPSRPTLVARDAFNGLLLWKRRLEPPAAKGRRQRPPASKPLLIAAGDRLYGVLAADGALCALDAATGRTLRDYPEAGRPTEAVFHAGKLLVADSGEAGNVAVRCVDAETGRLDWKNPTTAKDLTVGGSRLFFKSDTELAGLDLATGRNIWRVTPSNVSASLFSYRDGVLLLASGWAAKGIYAHSAEDGAELWQHMWEAPTRVLSFTRFFLVGDRIWAPLSTSTSHAVAALDLKTGDLVDRFRFPRGYPREGHHRCYASRATTRYILTALNNIDVIDIEKRTVTDARFVRGLCGIGILPCNGLLYVPPHPCQCDNEQRYRGFMALSAGPVPAPPSREDGAPLLTRGPARPPEAAAQSQPEAQWPAYRHDGARSAATSAAIPAALREKWAADAGAAVTAPTAAAGKVFVGSPDANRVAAFDASTGKLAWTRATGGPVDTPPTIRGGVALFGCRDGRVYAARADDGSLLWTLSLPGADRRVIVDGRLESARPVYGSVLTRDDAAFFSAGRSSFLDGGIRVYAVEPLTGKLLWQSVATNTGINDLMVDDGETVHVRFEGFDARDGTPRTRGEGPGPLVSATGMLDPAWPPRVSWRRPGAEGAWGELLAFRGPTTCGVLSFSDYGYVATKHFSTMPDVGMSPCRIFARGGGVSWETRVNVRPQALVLAGDKLVVAGTPVALDEQDPWGAFEGRRGGELLVLSAADGRETDRLKLDSPPVYDGLAVADGRLFMACRDGTLRCFGEP